MLCTDSFLPNHYQTAPYVSNGYFGQTLPSEGMGYWVQRGENGSFTNNSWPLDQPRATFGTVSGFWNLQENTTHFASPENLRRGGESVISGIPDWTGLLLTTADGNIYRPGVDSSTVRRYRQCMSAQNGIVQTNVTWQPPSNTAFHLNYTILAHRTRATLGLVRLDIAVHDDTTVQVTDLLDGAGAVRSEFESKGFDRGDSIWTSVKPYGISNVTAHIFSTIRFDGVNPDPISTKIGNPPRVSTNASTIAQQWKVDLKRGDQVTIYKFVGIASSDAFGQSASLIARSSALQARSIPWNLLLREHTNAWDQTWNDSDIIIPENVELQRAARASLFQILTNLPNTIELANSIHVGGLTSDSYAGLVFWDADTWIYPAIQALHPQSAVTILKYRSRLLGQAIDNAKLYGYAGALYPWTSGRFGNCTGTGMCKDYQYHLNTDIAQSLWNYFLQSNNLTWLAETAYPVIKGVADMFAAYVKKNQTTGKYETILLGEPDEFAYFKDNGAFTNAGIAQLLGEWAPTAARLLNQSVPKNWSQIVQNIEMPLNDQKDITLGFTGMPGDWVVKQASYSATTTPGGPAMTWSVFAISEAQIETQGCAAYTYLLRSYEPYIRKPFYQFSETALDSMSEDNPAFPFGFNPAFPFLTGAGGFLQIFTHGLTGMRLHSEYLHFDPVLPPQLPHGVVVKGLKWRGATLDVTISLNDSVISRRLSAEDSNERVLIQIGKSDQTLELLPGQSITLPTRRPDLKSKNLAACTSVSSTSEFVSQMYPLSMVDGSNSTYWQPTDTVASVIIDLGQPQNVSGVNLIWGPNPPRSFDLGIKVIENNDFIRLSTDGAVSISSPYRPKEAELVRIRQPNITINRFENVYPVRYINLTVKGSWAAGQSATVAELDVF
ncbi:glycoside hydrolase family 65 protein [Aspergillus campestris IBT 28561]|uniref:alpha,alpha-trehalase n=1 Tax=Aspergillus campestris (strain IBT 28561) TaxID=1392248 RepID=A0A2I1CQD0_ASPC2|nr:glycoside hydrolase family 65 protein [Aspergillus campestris IBT 28561]PKX99836.1 glycoside hydrolase family 65 protein [Aspergillus campestris IBT 28561]